ncbi:MAG: hypothetical protein R3Y63_15350 [Eubacteriales bacterium]
MNKNRKPSSLFSLFLTVLLVSIMVLSVLFSRDRNKINDAYTDIMQIDLISSYTQRLISLAVNKEHTNSDVLVVNDLTENALSVQGAEVLSSKENPSVTLRADEVLQNWYLIQEILLHSEDLSQGEGEIDLVSLKLARDAHFTSMRELSVEIGLYTQELKQHISFYQLLITVFTCLITLMVFTKELQIKFAKERLTRKKELTNE